MNGAVFEAHSKDALLGDKPYGLLILGLLVFATLGGFPVLEKLRTLQLASMGEHSEVDKEEKEPHVIPSLQRWWVVLYSLTLPLAIGWLGYSFLEQQTAPLVLVGSIFAYLFTTDWHPEYWKRLWLAPVSYGIRGCLVTGFLWESLWHMATKHPEQHLEFMSAASFGMAAWLSCGLGSFAGWTAHPEYGDFRGPKRHILSLIQCCFLCGFAFLLASLLQDDNDDHSGDSEVTHDTHDTRERHFQKMLFPLIP